MRDYLFLTDSTCDLTPEVYEANGIERFMLHFYLNDKEYPDDGKTLFGKEFYDMMSAGAMPTTAQINPETFAERFREIAADGKDIFYLAFSSGLSGTYQSACIAANEVMEEYPECKIVVVDSLAACGGEGVLALWVAEKKRQGLSLEELRVWTEAHKQNAVMLFTVTDLNHLHRGGRLSKTSAIAGTLLGIKPVMYANFEGKLHVALKVRGRRAALSKLVEKCASNYVQGSDYENQVMIINHANCPEDAQWMADAVRERTGVKDIKILPMGPVIGSHVGTGCIALFYYGENREF